VISLICPSTGGGRKPRNSQTLISYVGPKLQSPFVCAAPQVDLKARKLTGPLGPDGGLLCGFPSAQTIALPWAFVAGSHGWARETCWAAPHISHFACSAARKRNDRSRSQQQLLVGSPSMCCKASTGIYYSPRTCSVTSGLYSITSKLSLTLR
jgi:hypothetical protein